MQTSTPLTPKDARQIALRQGLLSGTFAGCLTLLGTACQILIRSPRYSHLTLSIPWHSSRSLLPDGEQRKEPAELIWGQLQVSGQAWLWRF